MEKKTVLIVWDDWYHPEANYREAVRKSFEENELWNVIKTHRVRDLLEMEPKPDLCIHFTVGCPEGEEGLSTEEEEAVKKLAEDGMGMIFIHAGMACIQDGTPFSIKTHCAARSAVLSKSLGIPRLMRIRARVCTARTHQITI